MSGSLARTGPAASHPNFEAHACHGVITAAAAAIVVVVAATIRKSYQAEGKAS